MSRTPTAAAMEWLFQTFHDSNVWTGLFSNEFIFVDASYPTWVAERHRSTTRASEHKTFAKLTTAPPLTSNPLAAVQLSKASDGVVGIIVGVVLSASVLLAIAVIIIKREKRKIDLEDRSSSVAMQMYENPLCQGLSSIPLPEYSQLSISSDNRSHHDEAFTSSIYTPMVMAFFLGQAYIACRFTMEFVLSRSKALLM